MRKNNHTTRKGAAMLLFILFFVVAMSSLLMTFARNLYVDAHTVSSLAAAKQSHLTGEAALEDVVYRFVSEGSGVLATQLDTLPGIASTTVSYDSTREVYIVQAYSTAGRAQRVTVVELERTPGSAFNYGIQTGNGGFRIGNNATIDGNVFSNGHIEGQGGANVTGDVISAGSDGYIYNMDIGGSAWSYTIESSDIAGDAYFNNGIGSNNINGNEYPYEVIDPESLPIPDETIDDWQTYIETNGATIRATDPECNGGTYTIDTDMILGDTKIECSLVVSGTGGGTQLLLNGSLWVVGDVTFQNGSETRVSSLLGSESAAIIADDPSNRDTSSTIEIRTGAEFFGSGHDDSFVVTISRNHAASMGESTHALTIGQNSEGRLVMYTNNGSVDISNNIELNAVTGHRIDIGNRASVTYEDGLQNMNFTGGPGATYHVVRWYQE